MPVNKFSRIAQLIEKQIDEGVYPVGTKLPSERDLARRYDLSHMTVNKALASLVDRKILKRLYGNGTYVNRPRRGISSRTIGIAAEIAEEIQHPPFAKMLPFFQEKGYITTVFNIFNTEALKQNLVSFLDEKPSVLLVDGSSRFPFEILKELNRKTSLVFFHRFESRSRFDAAYVLSDYRKGGYLAARHLLARGRRKIIVVSFPRLPGNLAEVYYQGCMRAFEEYRVEPAGYILSREASEESYRQLFSSADRPDGILAFGDFRAVPALEALKRLHGRMPDDVSVMGYYDTPWSRTYNFPSMSLREENIMEKAWEILRAGKNERLLIEPVPVTRD